MDRQHLPPAGGSAPKLVSCYVDPAHNLNHLSLILAGFIELAADQRIELRIDSGRTGRDAPPMECVLEFDLQLADGDAIPGAFDVYDRSDVFDTNALERCAIYLKRSFCRPDIDRLADIWRSKVAPFGPNFACRSVRDWTPNPPRPDLRSAREDYRNELPFEEYELMPDAAIEATIVFQTRVWPPGSTSDDVEELNGSRVAIVRALRSAFGKRFFRGPGARHVRRAALSRSDLPPSGCRWSIRRLQQAPPDWSQQPRLAPLRSIQNLRVHGCFQGDRHRADPLRDGGAVSGWPALPRVPYARRMRRAVRPHSQQSRVGPSSS